MKQNPKRNKQPIFIFVGCLLAAATFIFLFWLIDNGNKKLEDQRLNAETDRANQLQASLQVLRDRSNQDVQFFELVRQLIITRDVAQHQALINRLKTFKFAEQVLPAPPNPPSTIPKSSALSVAPTTAPATTTTTRPRPKPPHKSRPPPTTTTTTIVPVVCVTFPFTHTTVCT